MGKIVLPNQPSAPQGGSVIVATEKGPIALPMVAVTVVSDTVLEAIAALVIKQLEEKGYVGSQNVGGSASSGDSVG